MTTKNIFNVEKNNRTFLWKIIGFDQGLIFSGLNATSSCGPPTAPTWRRWSTTPNSGRRRRTPSSSSTCTPSSRRLWILERLGGFRSESRSTSSRSESTSSRSESPFSGCISQSKELTRGPPSVSSEFSIIGGVHIGARVLHVLNLIWFG
jgi:hypothetical protein